MYRPVLSGVVIPHGEPGIEEKKKQILFEEYKEEREREREKKSVYFDFV